MRRSLRIGATCLLFAVALGACGARSESDQVRSTVRTFRDATGKHDYITICREVLAPTLVARLRRLGVPCELALSRYLKATTAPELTVARVVLHGARAEAYVTAGAKGQSLSRDILGLVKTGAGWRIASLSAPGAQ